MPSIEKITRKIMEILEKQKFLKHLAPLQIQTLEEDIFELLEKWQNVTKEQ